MKSKNQAATGLSWMNTPVQNQMVKSDIYYVVKMNDYQFNEKHSLYLHTTLTYQRKSFVCP